jgi:hypothetical protein
MFRKCSDDNQPLKPSQLRSLAQMWYIPTEEEVEAFMRQDAIASAGASGINSDTYLKVDATFVSILCVVFSISQCLILDGDMMNNYQQ